MRGPPPHTAILLAHRGRWWFDPVAAVLAVAVSLLPQWQPEEELAARAPVPLPAAAVPPPAGPAEGGAGPAVPPVGN